jgi:hypothetical protein
VPEDHSELDERLMEQRRRMLDERDAAADDEAVIRRALLRVLENPKSGQRVLTQAATQLRRLNGHEAEPEDDFGGPDTMRDLDLIERVRNEVRDSRRRGRLWEAIDRATALGPGPGRDALLDTVEELLGSRPACSAI